MQVLAPQCSCKTFQPEPIIISFNALVKAVPTTDGQRLIKFEASSEARDTEGDVILQSALLKTADSFVTSGHLDIDHFSELGRNPAYAYLGIKDPESWIIGKPLEVMDLGDGRTGVKAELFKSVDGVVDTKKYKYDLVWSELKTSAGVYRASIYGFPGPDTEVGTCAIGASGESRCATRYLVKTFNWKSTALTKHPVNTDLKYPVSIITAKSFAAKLLTPFPSNEKVFTREDIRQVYNTHLVKSCPSTQNGRDITIWAIRDHFMKCEYLTFNMADLYALATSEIIARQAL